jgi:hypothetical protein
MKTLFFAAILLATTCLASSSEVAVKPDDGWTPASESQVAALASQPGFVVLDFSLRKIGGAGFILKSTPPKTNRPNTVEQVVEGYISSIKAAGNTDIERSDCHFAQLKGVCVRSVGHAANGPTRAASYLLFAKDTIYVVSVLGPAQQSDFDVLCADYRQRIEISPSVIAGSIETNPDYELGRTIGLYVGRYLFIFVIGALVFMGGRAFFRKMREDKEHK